MILLVILNFAVLFFAFLNTLAVTGHFILYHEFSGTPVIPAVNLINTMT